MNEIHRISITDRFQKVLELPLRIALVFESRSSLTRLPLPSPQNSMIRVVSVGKYVLYRLVWFAVA